MFRPKAGFRSLALLAFLSLLALGCSDHSPTEPGPAPISEAQFSLQTEGSQLPGQYVAFLKTNKMASFEAKVRAHGGAVTFSHPIGLALLAGLNDAAAAELGADSAVTEMFPDVRYAMDAPLGELPVQSVADVVGDQTDPSSAGLFGLQWNMVAIQAPEAWDEGRTGSPDVTVAILDTGIDYLHWDLEGRVDLTRSTSFLPDEDDLAVFLDLHPIIDFNYHGTHVASTAVSNGIVAAGVSSETTLMGVKVCDMYGICPFGAVIAGVLYATDAGADVINLSLGGYFTKAHLGVYVGFINKVFNYAGSKGAVVVVAAGNEGMDLDHDRNGYKTYCSTPTTLCVSATGPAASVHWIYGPWEDVDAPADYTNYGRSAINVAAPGGTEGVGYVWAACSHASFVPGLFGVCGPGTALALTGTSMAAPHVAGLAALAVAEVGRRPGRVKTLIQQGADDLGKKGTDPFYGKGRINVYETFRR